jgi:hypothetical protein
MVEQLYSVLQSIKAKYDRWYGLLFASQEQRARVSEPLGSSVCPSFQLLQNTRIYYLGIASRHRRRKIKRVDRLHHGECCGTEACLSRAGTSILWFEMLLDKRDECSNGDQQMNNSLLDVEPWMRTLDDRLLLKFRIPSEAYR